MHVHRHGLIICALTALAAAALIPAVGSAHAHTPRAHTTSAMPPRTLTGQPITPYRGTTRLSRGAVLASADIFSTRVLANATRGFALASESSADYPVLTSDGGRTWRIAGPVLHIAAADGPDGVSSVGVTGTDTYYAWGFNAVDVTSNAGASWFRVHPAGQVVAVVPGDRGLALYEQITDAESRVSATVQYVSTDDGRRWRLSDALGG